MKKHALSLLVLSSFYAVSVQCSSKARRHSSHSSEGEEITAAINAHDTAALKKFDKDLLTGRLGLAITKFTLDNENSRSVLAYIASTSTWNEVNTALTNAQKASPTPDRKRRNAAIAAILSKALPHLSN